VYNDTVQRFASFLISNGKKGEESEIAERQRESVCEAEHCGKRKIASAIKQRINM
jgi:hypothetical protein